MTEEYQLVVVFAGNPLEAGLVKSVLDDNEIASYLKDEVIGTLFPWYGAPGGMGAIKVLVERRDLDRAAHLVRTLFDNESDGGGSD